DFEMVACGGTHPSTAGQIGLLKILGAQPSRGKLRLSFVCGGRALRDYRMRMDSVDAAAALLSVKPEGLPGAVEKLKAEAAAFKRELAAARRQAALDGVPKLLENAARTANGALLVVGRPAGLTQDALRELASSLVDGRDAVALIGSAQERGVLLAFARSGGLPIDAGRLMRQATGGKGGGKPDFAQGAAPDGSALEAARALALSALGGPAEE
ncbi:MAG: hypothetical protein GX558_09525, partial [Clostridiales bacterium]|nr:hypothetical protein [Clostridiales bacterium]